MLKKIGLGFMFLLLALLFTVYLTGNEHMLRGLRSTYFIGKSKPDIDDMKWFDLSVMKHDSIDVHFPTAKAYGMLQLTPEEEAVHAQYESTAFLVFKRDTLIFEKYFGDGGVDVVSNSFSMAKSYTAILIGVAIDEGLIKSVDQPVSDFLPEFKEGENAKLTIKHLLQMASGIPFGESYASPFGYMAKAYFGDNLQEATAHFRVKTEPGTGWVYEGGNTVLLGEILMKATGKSVSQYFEEKIWSKIDTGHDAYWNLDRQGGMEKVFSGFYATARDFSRVGMLYENNGVWRGDTLLSPAYVQEAITPCMITDITPEKSTGEKCSWYGYQWWMGKVDGHDFFCTKGLRGQYVIVIPDLELIVTRLGHTQSKDRIDHHPADLYEFARMGIRMNLP